MKIYFSYSSRCVWLYQQFGWQINITVGSMWDPTVLESRVVGVHSQQLYSYCMDVTQQHGTPPCYTHRVEVDVHCDACIASKPSNHFESSFWGETDSVVRWTTLQKIIKWMPTIETPFGLQKLWINTIFVSPQVLVTMWIVWIEIKCCGGPTGIWKWEINITTVSCSMVQVIFGYDSFYLFIYSFI